MLIKSVLRDWLSVSYGMISILVIGSLRSPPYPAAPDFHLKVKRLTMICASLALLQIMFAVHPRESVSHDSQVALLPYSTAITDSQYFARHCVPSKYVRWCDSCSLATPMQRAELNTARESSHKSPARDDGADGPPIVISTEAKRSGEISFL